MKNIALIGSDGQLGTDIVRACRDQGSRPVELTQHHIDIRDAEAADVVLSAVEPDVVINTAALQGSTTYTAVDQAAFFSVNAIGVWNLARWCQRHDCMLVHYSTDYVFGKDRRRTVPYTEEDPPYPVNAYGNSKLAGEYFVGAFCRRHYVIRLASLYGSAGCLAKWRSNFVKMVLGKARNGDPLEVVDDQIMSPTWTLAVATKTLELIESGAEFGLYHMAGSGACSWYEFACEIIRIIGAAIDIRPVRTPEEGTDSLFLRPRYTALDNAKLRHAGLADLISWRDALEQYIRQEEIE